MKYAFVTLSILAIWIALIAIVATVPNFSPVLAQSLAVFMTIILFIIGFRKA